jgi:hypothetical protein
MSAEIILAEAPLRLQIYNLHFTTKEDLKSKLKYKFL